MANPTKIFQVSNQISGYWKVDNHNRVHANASEEDASIFYPINIGYQLAFEFGDGEEIFVGTDIQVPGLIIYSSIDPRCVFGAQACEYQNNKANMLLSATYMRYLAVMGNNKGIVPNLHFDKSMSLDQNMQNLQNNTAELERVCFDFN